MKFMFHVVVFFWLFWSLFALCMSLYRDFLLKRLTIPIKVLGMPWILLMLLVDVGTNLVVSLPLLDPPTTWTLSQRLSRYIKQGYGWRCALAKWVCRQLLDPLDPRGSHCN